MEVYDDRPVSFYDNLKAPTNTSTPNAKTGNTTAATAAAATATAATTIITSSPSSSPARPPPPPGTVVYTSLALPSASPAQAAAAATVGAATNGGATHAAPIYADLSFNFNDNKQRQLQQQQQQQQQKSEQQLPSYSHNQYPQSLSQQQRQQVQPHFGSGQQQLAAANNTALQQQQQQHDNSNKQRQIGGSHTQTFLPTSAASTAAATAAVTSAAKTVTMPTAATKLPAMTTTPTTASAATSTPAARNASPAQRPLSQHSQTELYEASQGIAAVKAALNDAKSKFFGLNGYAAPQDNSNNVTAVDAPNSPSATPQPNNNVNESQPARRNNATPRLLIDQQFPQIQIVTTAPTPPPKPQPKYQNIPENSAVYRREMPPELPPKPVDVIIAAPTRLTTSTPSPPPSTTAALPMTSTPLSTPAPATSSVTLMPTSQQASPATSTPSTAGQAKILPHLNAAAYKQIPLNDIDTPQPSQAVYMSTTVPQNIKGSKIAGRHTPTRNSLRHSRMLVVNNKPYPGTQHPNPMNFKYPNLARWLLILEIIVGLLISFLAIWIFFLAPNSVIQDNPYWSGLVLLLAGLLGLVLVRYQRIKRHKVRENCFIFLRADSYLLALLAALLCCVALICAAIHFARLSASDTRCFSTNMLLEHGSCTCTFNANDAAPARNSSAAQLANGLFDEEEVPEQFEDRSYKVEYRDLSCKEVKGAWLTVLGLSMGLNSLGLLLTLIYLVLLVCCRHNSKHFYTSVHTSTF